MLDPRICNIGHDANALDRDGSPRDALADRFGALASDGTLTVVIAGGVRDEILHPHTPTDVKEAALPQLFNLRPGLTASQHADRRRVAAVLQGNARPGKHAAYLYGVGDADIQAALIHDFDARWTAGGGARLIAPTGGDTLGTGKWQIMPIFGVRYALSEINPSSYLEPVVRYAVSFAGDPSAKNISNLQFAPTFNLGLPDRWFITFYPSADIRVNYGDPVTGQSGRLFLPFDARIGRKLTDNLVLSLEVGVPIIKDYPVYNFKTEVRLNLTY